MTNIRETVGKHPQESYSAVVRVVQSECIFLQRVTSNMGYTFIGVENIIWETFLTRLFFGKSKSLTPIIGTLITIPVKKAVLSVQNSMTSVDQKYIS